MQFESDNGILFPGLLSIN